MTDFELIFGAGGGITLIAAGNGQQYSDPGVLAWDVARILDGEAYWSVVNGGVAAPEEEPGQGRRLSAEQVLTAIAWHGRAGGTRWLDSIPNVSERQFFAKLFDLRCQAQTFH